VPPKLPQSTTVLRRLMKTDPDPRVGRRADSHAPRRLPAEGLPYGLE
jgi:hypothetical protein